MLHVISWLFFATVLAASVALIAAMLRDHRHRILEALLGQATQPMAPAPAARVRQVAKPYRSMRPAPLRAAA